MRNPIDVLKSLESKATQENYKFQRLYRNLYNPEFYLLAYQNIAKSTGSMTSGADGMTLDGMSMTRINRIIASLKDHSYQPNPARRHYIAKKNNPSKKRPLGIPSTDDKLVQEVVRMLLEAIYEPTFSEHSHGFRPGRSCHTALKEVQANFTGVNWVIEGDITACFDCFDHHVLIEILRRRIQDEHFISLMWKFLKVGYMEQWEYHRTFSGTPQGSGVSPILANIYLTELDRFMETFTTRFNRDSGKGYRLPSPEYNRVHHRYNKAKKNLSVAGDHRAAVREFKQAQQRQLDTPSFPQFDPQYKRLQYNRYADDFVVGVIGSREDAERIKSEIGQFLSTQLKLTLSAEKTKVTHSSKLIRYLGYDFTVRRCKAAKRGKDGILRRHLNYKVALYVPHDKWESKLWEYRAMKIARGADGQERWKPIHRGFLMHRTDVEIISKYNSEIRGLYNFYCLAENVTVLNKFCYIMEGSMLKTFAAKFNTTVNKIKKKYKKDGVFGAYYDTKVGRKLREFYHEGFERKNSSDAGSAILDILPQFRKYERKNGLAHRLKAGKCEFCSAKTEEIRMHHVKRLKDLTGDTEVERLMLKMRRKSIALCPECFGKLQHQIMDF